jgi:hypothetical protein
VFAILFCECSADSNTQRHSHANPHRQVVHGGPKAKPKAKPRLMPIPIGRRDGHFSFFILSPWYLSRFELARLFAQSQQEAA